MNTINALLSESESNGFGEYFAKLHVAKPSWTKSEMFIEMSNWSELSTQERNTLFEEASARAALITHQMEDAEAEGKPKKRR